MKIDHSEAAVAGIRFTSENSFGIVTDLVKGLLTGQQFHDKKLSYWQLIMLQSKANGCFYCGDDLPQVNWKWPKNTWFQERLSQHINNFQLAAQP